MEKYIYKVIEVNVNGSGENAEEYICSSLPLVSQQKIFANILKEMKIAHSEDDYDTSDFIQEACELFNDRFSGYNLKLYIPRIMDVFKF